MGILIVTLVVMMIVAFGIGLACDANAKAERDEFYRVMQAARAAKAARRKLLTE